MMKKLTALLILSLAITYRCEAQKTAPVKNIYLFKKVQMAGNIAVDEKGNQISPSRFVSYEMYAEVSSAVLWDTLWIEGKAYLPEIEEIIEKRVEIGRQKLNNKIIRLMPDKGYKLFRLSLSETGNYNFSADQENLIRIRYHYKKKSFRRTMNNVVELNMPPNV